MPLGRSLMEYTGRRGYSWEQKYLGLLLRAEFSVAFADLINKHTG